MSNNLKATNPKDAIGGTKLPLDLIPDTGLAYAALAFLEGALKYGKFNWRIAGVRWSVYEAALKRHLQKVKEGEWADPETKVPHIGNMLACLLILADAYENDMLVDDRPPSFKGAPDFIDGYVLEVEHLKNVFKEHNPKQYTIKDTKDEQGSGDKADRSDTPHPESYGISGEDAQSLPGWDSGRMVLGAQSGLVGGVQVGVFESFTPISTETEYETTKNLCNFAYCSRPECTANRLAQGQVR